MSVEIELKLRVQRPEDLTQHLQQLGALPRGVVLETNRIFDTSAGRLRAAGCGLRLRINRPRGSDRAESASAARAVLTYKGPRTSGIAKQREELETAVADPVVMQEILQRLGFQEVILYEKQRASWELGDCEVLLDELPRLGWFVEIEGPELASIEHARQLLGLQTAPAVPETYVELAAAHGVTDEAGRRSLRFAAT